MANVVLGEQFLGLKVYYSKKLQNTCKKTMLIAFPLIFEVSPRYSMHLPVVLNIVI